MTDKELEELNEMLKGYYSPCVNGHIFLWTGNSTSKETCPPDDAPCKCGRFIWKDIVELLEKHDLKT